MAKGNSFRKLKYSEWRPIGVCDDAPPGVQKAQMFTREDFLIITGTGVDRQNWRKHPEVMKLLNKYALKLAGQSTKTSNMIQPKVSKISLVGAVMKLVVTPTLNKESKDGKLQLFQIEFEDIGKKKKTPWKLILGILITILVLLCILLGVALYKKAQSKQYKPGAYKTTSFTTSFCDDSGDISLYKRQLDEANRILQVKADDLFYQGKTAAELNCMEQLPQVLLREHRFLKCFALVRRFGLISQLPRSELMKINACQRSICRKSRSANFPACFQ